MFAGLAAGVLLCLPPILSRPASIDSLYCNGLIQTTTDTPELIYVRKAILNDSHLRVWVERYVPRNTEMRYPIVTFDENWGIGYEFDGSAVTGILPMRAPELTMILSFSHLRRGPHRLRIGLMSPDGRLMDDNAFCFSSPGQFALTNH
jgi:hypothetical protein